VEVAVRLPVPGPSDLVDVVRDIARSANALTAAAGTLVRLVPRLEGALDRAEVLLERSERAVGRLDAVTNDAAVPVQRLSRVVERADGAVGRIEEVMSQLEDALQQANPLLDRSRAVVKGVERTTVRVNAVVTGTEAAVVRGNDLLTTAAVAVEQGQAAVDGVRTATDRVQDVLPLVERLAAALGVDDVDALVLLLQRLPTLIATLDGEVVPLVGELRQVEPELRAMFGIVDEMHDVITGVPGAKRLLRRSGSDDAAEPTATATAG